MTASNPETLPTTIQGESPFAGPGRFASAFAERLPWWQRGILLAVGLVLVSLLVTAARLAPNPRGMGTHQQLGLPPCSFVMLAGIRCPACGMTTSWAHLLRGQVLQSAHANAGGMLLALAAMFGGPWMLASALVGRWWPGAVHPIWIAIGGGLIFTLTAVQWGWRLLL